MPNSIGKHKVMGKSNVAWNHKRDKKLWRTKKRSGRNSKVDTSSKTKNITNS